jgi:integrase
VFNTGIRITGAMTLTWRHYHGDHVWLPPRISVKGIVGKRVELNDQARACVEAMRGYHPERVFPWPESWPASRSALYDEHNLIRQCLPKARREFLAYHALRKLHNNELAAINGLACMKSLGHASGRTTVEHYTSRKVVADAVQKLPRLPVDDQRQQRLFD